MDSIKFNLDAVSECVNILIEQIKCSICGRKEGARVRCACGAAACVECSPCSLCQTVPRPDCVLTSRVANVNNLLKAFESTFHTDVYRRRNTLERLKVEREIFPQCIQAPFKYYNKRKPEFGSTSDVNRRSFEKSESENIFASNILINHQRNTNPLAHVHEWLKKHATIKPKTKNAKIRKPLSVLNENRGVLDTQKSASMRGVTFTTTTKKRLHVQTANTDSHQESSKRSKLDDISPFEEMDVDENNTLSIGPRHIRNLNNEVQQVTASSGAQILVTAEVHSQPVKRKPECGKGGSDVGDGNGSTGSSDKENRDPNAVGRRGHGGDGGGGDDPSSQKQRQPFRQTWRSRLRVHSKKI